ncbi:C39 family peptidase [Eubacterium sp.]|uniref:C39 family peptidase n=1 Tax=Eubacterium sp. TaxID=142586 RepID=UPI0025EE2CF4|nr:C39 family peptidase [Eubacterium sp.]MCR5629349.1 C39 family peptidase [Eubacterium sp.]
MKMNKKKVAILSLFIMTLSTSHVSEGLEQKNELYVTDDLLVDCDSTEPLYNNDDNLIAYYVEGDRGYAIIGVDGTLIEFSEDCKIEDFDSTDNEKSYYGGAGSYYVETESEDELKDLYSGEVVEKNDTTNIEIEANETKKEKENYIGRNVSNDKKSVTITYPKGIKDSQGKSTYTNTFYKTLTLQKYGSIPNRTRYFCHNHNDTCGSTASAIMMYYYYDHISNSYIKNDSYKGNSDKKQEAFVNHFIKIIDDNGKGTGYKKLKKGINNYLDEIGKEKNCKYITRDNILSTVSSQIESIIDDNKPCIVGLTKEPVYGEHWVVGGGYARYYGINGRNRGRVYFIKVNNGLGSSREKNIVYVNYDYVDGVMYLD